MNNQIRILMTVIQNPNSRIGTISGQVGLTVQQTRRIINDLRDQGDLKMTGNRGTARYNIG